MCRTRMDDVHVKLEFHSLLGRNGFLQHGGLFVSLQAKAIFALLLQTEEQQPFSVVSAGCFSSDAQSHVTPLAFLRMMSMYPAMSWEICSPSVVCTE